ncbi:MAG: hypothetical protein Q9219_007175, partial [cf. Caloplaca sp. 3 TL-2023]
MRFDVTKWNLLLCLLVSHLIEATFIDEAYLVDFHHALLGAPQPQTTFLHCPSVTSRASLLYTLSTRSVLGAINPKDGSILWRQQLEDGNGLVKPSSKGNLIISAVNGTVQAWDAADGKFVWDWRNPDEIKALEISPSNIDDHGVYVLTQGHGGNAYIRKFTEDMGTLEWEYQDDSGDMPQGLSVSRQGVFYVAIHSALLQNSKIRSTSLESSSGATLTTTTLNADTDFSNTSSSLFIESTNALSLLLWTDPALKGFRVNILGTNQVLTAKLSLDKDGPIAKLQIQTLARDERTIDVLVHCQSATSHWLEVYHLDLETVRFEKSFQIPDVEGHAKFSATVHDGHAYLVRIDKRDVTLFSSGTENILGRWSLQSKLEHHVSESYETLHAISEVVAKGRSSYAVRSVLLLSSGDLKMVQNGEELWSRPESLSGVVAAAWVETDSQQSLVEEMVAESYSNIGRPYMHRIKRHTRDTRRFLSWVENTLDRTIYGALGNTHRLQEGMSLPGTKFGFHKVVVAATDTGRLFALDVGKKGKILWSIQVSVIEAGQRWAVKNIEGRNGVAIVQVLGGGSLAVSARQGVILENRLASMKRGLKTTINLLDPADSIVSIDINSDGTIGLTGQGHDGIPDTVVVTQDEQLVIRGWSLGISEPLLVWTFIPRPHEKNITVAARPSDDPVASIGRALGDRNVLYKFLKPNLLVISTVNVATSSALFYVLDSASGQIVHTLTHPKVDIYQPIKCIVSENWFAYIVFSEFTEDINNTTGGHQAGADAYQIVVSELFESSLANDRGAFMTRSNISGLHPSEANADDRIDHPHVVSQSYLVPAAVSFMTVSSTLQGITPRSIICVVPSLNSLLAIPRTIIDPRRPVGRDATSTEMEEGLFRHDTALMYDPKWALNHMQELHGIQKVITSPSLLESTSLIFAFGHLDMFGTRISPIGGFDILGKGFNKIQLIGTVAALALGTGLLAPL